MKTCTVYGDLASEKSSENYPTVQVCDQCVKEQTARKENSQIVQVGSFDPDYGDECEFCGKSLEDENDEL